MEYRILCIEPYYLNDMLLLLRSSQYLDSRGICDSHMEWCQLLYACICCPGICHWNRTLISLLVTDARGSCGNGLEMSHNGQLVSVMPNARDTVSYARGTLQNERAPRESLVI